MRIALSIRGDWENGFGLSLARSKRSTEIDKANTESYPSHYEYSRDIQQLDCVCIY